jgi:hypothetical protein
VFLGSFVERDLSVLIEDCGGLALAVLVVLQGVKLGSHLGFGMFIGSVVPYAVGL